MDEKGDLIQLAWRLIYGDVKLRKEEKDVEKLRSLLVDLRFYCNYFFTLAKHSWWGISPQQLHLLLLDDKIEKNEKMRHELSNSIEDYLYLSTAKVSVLEENLLLWKTQLVHNYSILMKAKPKSQCYICHRNMVQFITNMAFIAFDLLRCRDDLDADEKKAILASLANLNFFRAFVQLAESEGMGSLLNCIQDYTCKVELLLMGLWTGKTQGDSLVSSLMQRRVNGDEPCSILIILEVFKISNTMLLGEGMSWRYQELGGEVSHNFIWQTTLSFLPQITTAHFIKHISYFISEDSQCGIQLLHELLKFLASSVDDLSLDMRVVFVRAAISIEFLATFSFWDLAEQVVIEQVKFQLSVLTTSLHISKAEVLLGKLLSHDSSLIILVMSLPKELKDGLEFLRKRLTYMGDGYLENKGQLISQIKALPCDTLSFLKLLGEHEMEEEACTEIDIAFFKLLGTTKLIQAHVLALELLYCPKEFQLLDQLVKLCDKLGFLVGLVKNLDENNVNQIVFLLGTGDVATEVASIISLFGMDMTEEKLKEGHLRLLHLIDYIELLEAELMLNSFLNFHVDLIVPFSSIEMLRNRFRLLRIILTDSTEQDSGDKKSVASSNELVKDAIPLVSKLFHNTSNKDMAMEMNALVSDLLQIMNAWETNVTAHYLQIRRSSQFTHPRTDGLGFIDCLVDSLSSLSSSMPLRMKYQIGRAFKDLKSSRSLLKDISWEHNEGDELDNLVSQLTRVAYEVEYVAEAFVIGDGNTWSTRLWISDLIDEIKQILVKIIGVLAHQSCNDGADNPLGISDRVLPPVGTSSSNEVVVGMKEQEEKVINQLTRGSTKLGIVSIVGMGGLGKTTLAKTVFNNPLVQHSFDVCAWCCISTVYQKREVLLDLLGYVIEVTPKIREMTDDDLSNRLRQLLLERTYLIVMDDIWDMGAWNELQQSFPKDEKRSRILLTSRNNDIASKTGYGFEPCSLDLLSNRESWELFERKLFEGGSCPLQFREVGWEIAMNCKGFPLAVVVISGLLSAKEMNLDWWKQVAGNLNSIVVDNSKTFTNILDMSYRYLPDYLKPCFLYFGTFQEDKKILVTNLIDLWTTEGFIRRKDDKNLNDVARDYLQELVSRNLVRVAERTSMGGIKACHVHDLLHELCWARAEEENFLHVVKDMGDSSALKHGPGSQFEASVKYEHRRVCIYSERRHFIESRPSGQCVRSLLFFATRSRDGYPLDDYDASFISLNFKLLRTLKLDSISVGDFLPDGFELLIHLRFLAVLGTMTSIPDSIECLSNLEIFYVKGLRGEIWLPRSIWSLKKLRHLKVTDRFAFSLDKEIVNELDNLVSLSSLFLPYGESTEHILQRLSRLQILKCIFSECWNESKNCNQFPSLNSLVQLESLKVLYHGRVRHPSVFSYPATLKKLTLSKFRLHWKEISAIGSLPCLEVLKLLFKAFEGEEWEVGSEEFQNLKYLKLDSLDIVQWTTSHDSFPCLEQIVLQSCKKLEEVPFAFAESPTLQMIRVQWCSKGVVKSVRDIEDEQFETLARTMNVIVHPTDS